MRQNFRPQLQVRCRLENRHLRRVHDDGVGLVHGMITDQMKTRSAIDVAQLLAEQSILPRKALGEREKSSHKHQRTAVAGGN